MRDDWEDRDDWDTSDWENLLGGPDDDDLDAAGALPEDTTPSFADENQEPLTDLGTALRTEESELALSVTTELREPDVEYVCFLADLDELNQFVAYIRKAGARDIRVVRNSVDTWDFADKMDLTCPLDDQSDPKAYQVSFLAIADLPIDVYRSGLRYSGDEARSIIDAYMRWTSEERIAYLHKRTASAIQSLLQKRGLRHFHKQDSDVRAVGRAVRLAEQVVSGSPVGWLPEELVELVGGDLRKPRSVDDLAEELKEAIVGFICRHGGVHLAIPAAARMRLHFQVFLLYRQTDDPVGAYKALCGLSPDPESKLGGVRENLRRYVVHLAHESLRRPLLNWSPTLSIDTGSYSHWQLGYSSALEVYDEIYEVLLGSLTPIQIEDAALLRAMLRMDTSTIHMLAVAGKPLAQWFFCARSRAMPYELRKNEPIAEKAWLSATDVLDPDWKTWTQLLQRSFARSLSFSQSFDEKRARVLARAWGNFSENDNEWGDFCDDDQLIRQHVKKP